MLLANLFSCVYKLAVPMLVLGANVLVKLKTEKLELNELQMTVWSDAYVNWYN